MFTLRRERYLAAVHLELSSRNVQLDWQRRISCYGVRLRVLRYPNTFHKLCVETVNNRTSGERETSWLDLIRSKPVQHTAAGRLEDRIYEEDNSLLPWISFGLEIITACRCAIPGTIPTALWGNMYDQQVRIFMRAFNI